MQGWQQRCHLRQRQRCRDAPAYLYRRHPIGRIGARKQAQHFNQFGGTNNQRSLGVFSPVMTSSSSLCITLPARGCPSPRYQSIACIDTGISIFNQ
jgi:hypothetical protein